LGKEDITSAIVYDNFSSGKYWHLEGHEHNDRLEIIHKDIYDQEIYSAAKDIDIVIMLAANPDIARAVSEPDIDFKQGTVLCQIVLEAMRCGGAKRLLYASGSGVYGDIGDVVLNENYSPMEPISTYGASKLACEALICSYSHMFNIKSSVFRFGNVVGGRQTHGVAYDFIRKLNKNPNQLEILGDGSQSKPYIHISDVINALEVVLNKQERKFEVFNVAPLDHLSVLDIAEIVMSRHPMVQGEPKLIMTGGDRGWTGDVPIVRLGTEKIRANGWKNSYDSKGAVELSVDQMLSNATRLFD
jgi:UDP-glucose 4-epimerase